MNLGPMWVLTQRKFSEKTNELIPTARMAQGQTLIYGSFTAMAGVSKVKAKYEM